MTRGSEKMSAKEKALKKLEEAKARLQQIEAREKENDRKAETRRKILLGAAVLQNLETLGGLDAVTLNWITRMPARDRALFTELEAHLAKKFRESSQAPQTAQRAHEPPQTAQRAHEPPQTAQRAHEPPQTAQPVDDFSYDLTTLGPSSSR